MIHIIPQTFVHGPSTRREAEVVFTISFLSKLPAACSLSHRLNPAVYCKYRGSRRKEWLSHNNTWCSVCVWVCVYSWMNRRINKGQQICFPSCPFLEGQKTNKLPVSHVPKGIHQYVNSIRGCLHCSHDDRVRWNAKRHAFVDTLLVCTVHVHWSSAGMKVNF